MKLVFQGQEEAWADTRTGAAAAESKGVAVHLLRQFQLGAERGGTEVSVEVDPDTVVELELAGGMRLWMRAEQLARDLHGAGQREGAADGALDVIVIPADGYPGPHGLADTSRGAGAWVIKVLRLFDVKVALHLGSLLDKCFCRSPGLHSWSVDNSLKPLAGTQLEGDEPILLFLHGTASSTRGSFGGLQHNKGIWQQLHSEYKGRVIALEHLTFSVSPMQNAIEVLEHLPPNARLHVVSHSRGGLIGELLCRGALVDDHGKEREPFDADDIRVLGDQGELARRLGELIAQKRPKIERFVRVACPARGTLFLDDRLDLWLSVMTDLIGRFVPELFAVPYEFVRDVCLAVIQERKNPRDLPGLEAMIPGSPFQRVINRADVVSNADLSIIKGDVEAGGLLGTIKTLVATAYFLEQNDLVVNTSAMNGGTRRAASGIREFFQRGPNVDHFHYFFNEPTAKMVLAGLRRKEGEHGGFTPIVDCDPSIRSLVPGLRSARTARGQPKVFVLPGFAGSQLEVGGSPVWLDLPSLAAGALNKLSMSSPVNVTALLDRHYGPLVTHLARNYEVQPFPYDWRQSVSCNATAFVKVLLDFLEADRDQPVRIVAHSMGGLIARLALAEPRIAEAFGQRGGSRLIMLGTPNRGSYSIPLMLMGRDTLMQMLAALDFKMNAAQHLKIVSRFPGVLDLLPDAPAGGVDFFDHQTWTDLHTSEQGRASWSVPDKGELEQAARCRQQLAELDFDPARMVYVAGAGLTPVAASRNGSGILFTRSWDGDGRVSWETGVPATVPTYYAPAAHGDLPTHPAVLAAISDILEYGGTIRLPSRRPTTRGTRGQPPVEREPLPVSPGTDELAAAAMGGRIGAVDLATAVVPVRIRVVHGNLAFARYPLMVGHYAGATIAGPEEHIDRLLQGALSRRLALGLYPDDIATAEVLLPNRGPGRGTVVVGLGNVGQLSAGDLQRTLTHGLLRYAVVRRELPEKGPEGGLRLSTLLVGGGSGGVSLSAAVNALLRALQRAQGALEATGFAEIEIVELYEHRAIQIWHEISRALRTSDLGGAMVLSSEVQHGEGGRRRVSEYVDPTWWQPLTITMEDVGQDKKVMRFIVPSGSARAEAMILPAQRSIVDSFISRAKTVNAEDAGSGTPARTLFELLMPPVLKDQMSEDRHLRLVLDPDCAYYPWELMDDRRPWENDGAPMQAGARKPVAVRTGMIRQLVRFGSRATPGRCSLGNRALVIGNPKAQGAPSLPGARAEAVEVARILTENNYEVTTLLDVESASAIMMALCAQEWKIVHIAAHGIVDEKDGRVGIVLGEGVVLTADLLERLLPRRPRLVFVNCCHLGAMPPHPDGGAPGDSLLDKRPTLAGNIAVKLIDSGVDAVIAAGWAVDDTAAKDFAAVFYSEVLDRTRPASLGEAVLKARAEIYDRHRNSTAWGAYQVYGEPGWRLNPNGHGDDYEQPHFGSPTEAVAAVHQIRQDAQTGNVRCTRRSLERLRQIEADLKGRLPHWLEDACLLTAFGHAFAELGDLAEAERSYRAAIAADPAHAPVQAIEQVENLRARQAVWDFRKGKINDVQAISTINETIRALDRLDAALSQTTVGGERRKVTVERYILKGAAYKRLAHVQAESSLLSGVVSSLRRMETAYRRAGSLYTGNTGRIYTYPVLMSLTALVLRKWCQGDHVRLNLRQSEAFEHARQAAIARDEEDPRFWPALAEGDAKLLLLLQNGTGDHQEVEQCYKSTWDRGGSELKMVSVFEQLDFIAAVLKVGVAANKTARDSLRQTVEFLCKSLRNSVGR